MYIHTFSQSSVYFIFFPKNYTNEKLQDIGKKYQKYRLLKAQSKEKDPELGGKLLVAWKKDLSTAPQHCLF